MTTTSTLPDAFPAAVSASGCIDYYSYSTSTGGTIVGGWIGFDWDDPVEPPKVILRYTNDTESEGTAVVVLHPREDIRKLGFGFVSLIQHDGAPRQPIAEALLFSGTRSFRLVPSDGSENIDETRALSQAKHFTLLGKRNQARARLLKLFDRPHYTGADTISQSATPLHIELDKVYLCPPASLVLRGWILDPFEQVARIKVRSGSATYTMQPEHWIMTRRPDVVESLGSKYGVTNDRCGFIAYVPDILVPNEPLYFEIETVSADVLFKPMLAPQSSGLGAIREILATFDLRYSALTEGYDHVIGPAIEVLNEFRLRQRPETKKIEFGTPIKEPRCSIIIPLYGRMDFVEYQLAFFSKTLAPDHEIVYVLDDPDKLREVEALSSSCLARFHRPFVLVTLEHNVGFAPANNIGLDYTTGKYICFLNSDVFPDNPDWLECMIETLLSRPNVGVVGARLLFEDGSIQHDCVTFKPLPEFDNWTFALHPNKGKRPTEDKPVTEVDAVTGACMVLKKEIAVELGGFDEGFVVGDFEDTDLCLRLRELGLSCLVDNRADLFHLERQSQGNQSHSWRMNLTLYNAWRFWNRWTRNA